MVDLRGLEPLASALRTQRSREVISKWRREIKRKLIKKAGVYAVFTSSKRVADFELLSKIGYILVFGENR